MWTKENRFLLVGKLYQIMFWQDFDSALAAENSVELPIIEDLTYPEGWDVFIEDKTSKMKILEKEFKVFLEQKLHDPSKTYLLVKAIFCASFIEKHELGEKAFLELDLPSVYGKLTQELVAGQSPELVYSVLKSA